MSALARSYAPFKKGDLEMGIRARRDSNSSSFTYKIGVQGRAAKYAWQLHEGFIWNQKHAGEYRLGRLSLAKALLNGKKVGPKYLERAYRELKPRIAQRVKDGLKDTITQISNKRRK
ncbi:hypothetical protein [Dyella telluris]|uniref:HK97 gp10 family phage protein n=1 Tax=Dyella telluris TaxID=2763498 RepID=A0A7G8Q4F9_9GAMM|nr:hypothetical protein [Dyella telluris]QNK01667.1 hypothetical protein H8F01_00355 [Dyella telluris]